NLRTYLRTLRFLHPHNATGEKIAMTTPVFFDGEPGAQEKMSLVMPEETVRIGVPAPIGTGMTREHVPAQRVSAYRFAGTTQPERERAAVATLRAWMSSENLRPVGEPTI